MSPAEKEFLAQMAIGVFSVDAEGRVWRHRRMSNGGSLKVQPSFPVEPPTRAENVVTPGYLRLQFTAAENRLQVYAHRIVWMVTNHSDIPPLMEVNHIDGDRANNHPSNLEVITKAENAVHALYSLGKIAHRNHPGGKLTPQQVVEIRALFDAKSLPQTEIGKRYGVSVKTIGNIGLRKTFKEIPG